MEALARHYLLARAPTTRLWPGGERFEHIFAMAKQYSVHGVISQLPRCDAEYDHDDPFLKQAMDERGIAFVELEVEYGEGPSTKFTTRCEAFLGTLQNQGQAVPKLGASSGSPEHCAATVAAAKPH
jgi:benzoyl-CoA reductase/2-hydroxyglutaryl-CoA dehydratase subunit BcrC/BadD/HgdB